MTEVQIIQLTLNTAVIFEERSAVCESMTEVFCRRRKNTAISLNVLRNEKHVCVL